jgi:signal transduction histidine kinase
MRVGGELIVLWAAKQSPDTCAWMMDPPPGVHVIRVAHDTPDALASAVPAALARGAVIAIVGSDREAHRALSLGVDEVVRATEASGDALTAASERARLRAIGRNARSAPPDADANGIELLSASVSYRLASPLAIASLNAEILRTAMGPVAGLADAYTRAASGGAQLLDSEAQRVVALRASAPATSALHATVNDLAMALREASTAAAQVYSLVSPDTFDAVCDLSAVVSEVALLVRGVIERVGDLRVELPAREACRCTVARSVVVQALSALLTNAMQAIRERPRRGAITVRVEARVSAAIVEVIDDGIGTGCGELEGGSGLSLVVARVRQAGGDVVVESEIGLGTTVRLFLPLLLRGENKDPGAN